jgi:hypothetical protein
VGVLVVGRAGDGVGFESLYEQDMKQPLYRIYVEPRHYANGFEAGI